MENESPRTPLRPVDGNCGHCGGNALSHVEEMSRLRRIIANLDKCKLEASKTVVLTKLRKRRRS